MSRATNFQRAHWAAIALEAFREQVGRDDDATSIQDLIADLGHYCRIYELDFVLIVANAIGTWCAEAADPDGFRLDPGPDVSILVAGRDLTGRHWRQSATTSKRKSRKGKGGMR